MGEPTPIDNLAKGKFLLDVFKFAGPIVLSMVVAFGMYKAGQGADKQRLINTETRAIENYAHFEREIAKVQKQIDENRDRYVTNDVLMAYLRGFERTLKNIEDNQLRRPR